MDESGIEERKESRGLVERNGFQRAVQSGGQGAALCRGSPVRLRVRKPRRGVGGAGLDEWQRCG